MTTKLNIYIFFSIFPYFLTTSVARESEDVTTSASRPRGLGLGVMIATVYHDEYDTSSTTGGRTDIYKSTTTARGRSDPVNSTATAEGRRNPVNSTSEAWRSLPAAVWGRRVARYASPCITLIGLAGNALSFLVIRRQRPRQTSFSVYLTMIAVVDWGSLVTWAYRWSLLVLWPRAMTSYECRFNIGLKYAFRMAGYFFILLLTIDRLVIHLIHICPCVCPYIYIYIYIYIYFILLLHSN